MPRFVYECTECWMLTPQDFVAERQFEGDEYPPTEVTSICGTRWGGCGEATEMRLRKFVDPESIEEVEDA